MLRKTVTLYSSLLPTSLLPVDPCMRGTELSILMFEMLVEVKKVKVVVGRAYTQYCTLVHVMIAGSSRYGYEVYVYISHPYIQHV